MSLHSGRPFYRAGFIGWFRGLFVQTPNPGTVQVATRIATVVASDASGYVGASQQSATVGSADQSGSVQVSTRSGLVFASVQE